MPGPNKNFGDINADAVGSDSNPFEANVSEINNAPVVAAADGPAEVQSVIDQADTNGVGQVYVSGPSDGTVTWEGSISVPEGMRVEALGDFTILAGDEANLDTVTLHSRSYNTVIYNKDADTGGTTNVLRPEIVGFNIDYQGGSKSNNQNHAPILLSECQLGRIENCYVENAVINVDVGSGWRAFGILLLDCENCLIKDSEGFGAGYEGVGIRGEDRFSVANNVNGTGGVHSFQIAAFLDNNLNQVGNPVGSKLINSRIDQDITVHGPGNNLAAGEDGFVYGICLENTSSKADIRIIGNHFGTRLVDTAGTIIVENVAEPNLKNITIEGHTHRSTSDIEEAAVTIANNGSSAGLFENITLRDVAAECAYLLEIDDPDTDGTWDNITVEDSSHATGEYTGNYLAVFVHNSADVGRLRIDNVEANGSDLLWYDATLDDVEISRTDLSEPTSNIVNKVGGGISRLHGEKNIGGQLPSGVSNVILEDGLGEESGTGTPTDTFWDAGDIVEKTGDGTVWQKMRDSTWVQLA